ncbi:hypothetical protein QIG24_27530, partial [Klebsiella pneumoniae]|nr:hypothetical protein [Klebsiella pneumoniae]
GSVINANPEHGSDEYANGIVARTCSLRGTGGLKDGPFVRKIPDEIVYQPGFPQPGGADDA